MEEVICLTELLIRCQLDKLVYQDQRKPEEKIEAAMLKLLIDTCVWIDLANDHHQHANLRALDRLVKEKRIVVLVPPLLRDEFERNKRNITQRNRQSLSAALKRAKELLDQHGEPGTKRQALEGLNFVDQRLPRLGDRTGIVALVDLLLKRAETLSISDDAKLRAVDRALAKKPRATGTKTA